LKIPLVAVFIEKGIPMGTALAFMMAVLEAPNYNKYANNGYRIRKTKFFK
jgi:hypothetical protein